MGSRSRLIVSMLIAFVASACTMIIELVAGRILAPYIGVSLYTWTSIIGVVLAGISLGNYVGGRLADRWASPVTLSLVYLGGGVSTIGILFSTQIVATGNTFSNLPLVPQIVAYTTVIFFLPGFILGMVSPIIIRLTLQKLESSGNVVGTIYAFSTLGSIVGTFLTGFYLISAFGTRNIIIGVAVILLVVGLLVGLFLGETDRRRIASTTGLYLGTIAVVGIAYFGQGTWSSPCMRETNYFCIQIHDANVDGHPVRALVLDHLIHAYNSPTDKTFIGYGYERVYSELTAYLTAGKPEFTTLNVGGGGYTFPMYLEAKYPTSHVDVLEIDPGVTETVYQHLGLAPDTRIETFNNDARLVMRDWTKSGVSDRYDLIYGDAFNDLSIPYHLTTREFSEMLRQLLKDDGHYLANVIDNMGTGEFLRAYSNTLGEVFPSVQLFSQGTAWDCDCQNTFVVVAGNHPVDYAMFQAYLEQANGKVYTNQMPQAAFDEYLASGQQIVLSDDYAPVDQLVARLFVERAAR